MLQRKKKAAGDWWVCKVWVGGVWEWSGECCWLHSYSCEVIGAWQCLKEPGSFRADRVVSQSGQKPATKWVNFFLSSLNELPSKELSLGSHTGTCAVTEMAWWWQTLSSSVVALVWSSVQEMWLHLLTAWGGDLWWTPCKKPQCQLGLEEAAFPAFGSDISLMPAWIKPRLVFSRLGSIASVIRNYLK